MPSLPVTTFSPEETEAFGEQIGEILEKGSVIALSGPLGAGKTSLVKGIARFLGISEEITSPTYTIISEYEVCAGTAGEAKIPFYHIDVYRLEGDEDFAAIGGADYLGPEGIAVVEWSERIEASLPSGTIRIRMEIADGNKRLIYAGDKF